MRLAEFIQSLFTEGKVGVTNQPLELDEEQLNATKIILQHMYHEDVLDMPAPVPDFSEEAALWAASYFYQAVHLVVMRDAGEEIIEEQLKPFKGDINPSVIYSVDLIFRSLSNLFELAKGLAPADILVKKLRETAAKWPFSSVGVDIEQSLAEHDVILSNRSIKTEYIDRIIQQKDQKRVQQFRLEKYIYETAGEQIKLFWPGFTTEQTTAL
jgi:MoxR-vWA-beta-propeller ternary system domain bpX4